MRSRPCMSLISNSCRYQCSIRPVVYTVIMLCVRCRLTIEILNLAAKIAQSTGCIVPGKIVWNQYEKLLQELTAESLNWLSWWFCDISYITIAYVAWRMATQVNYLTLVRKNSHEFHNLAWLWTNNRERWRSYLTQNSSKMTADSLSAILWPVRPYVVPIYVKPLHTSCCCWAWL